MQNRIKYRIFQSLDSSLGLIPSDIKLQYIQEIKELEKEIFALTKMNPKSGDKEIKHFTSNSELKEEWIKGDGTAIVYDIEVVLTIDEIPSIDWRD